MFKKVIGQEASESTKPSLVSPEDYAPQVSSPVISKDTNSVANTSISGGSSPSATGMRNVLSSDVEIKGTVKFQNDLIVDGNIEGEIQSTGNLTVGENARIKAEIKTGTVVIYGKVHGNVTATERVELKSGSEVVGDIKSKTLVIESGAIFVGRSTVGTPTDIEGASLAANSKKAASTTPEISQPALAV